MAGAGVAVRAVSNVTGLCSRDLRRSVGSLAWPRSNWREAASTFAAPLRAARARWRSPLVRSGAAGDPLGFSDNLGAPPQNALRRAGRHSLRNRSRARRAIGSNARGGGAGGLRVSLWPGKRPSTNDWELSASELSGAFSFLSTGEIGLADQKHSVESSRRPADGRSGASTSPKSQRLCGFGHEGLAGASRRSGRRGFVGLCKTCLTPKLHGWLGPAFVRRLTEGLAAAKGHAREIVAGFVDRASLADDTGQARRAAERFGVGVAAGELAIAYGLVPSAARRSGGKRPFGFFRRWAAGFGRTRLREDKEILTRIRDAIESQAQRFWDLETGDMAGFLRAE